MIERLARENTLEELLVSHFAPGLVLETGIFVVVSLLAQEDVTGTLLSNAAVLPYFALLTVFWAAVFGILLDVIRHQLRPFWVTVSPKLEDNVNGIDDRRLAALGRQGTLAEKVELLKYLRVRRYHWGEFYGSMAIALTPLTLAGQPYLARLFPSLGGWQYYIFSALAGLGTQVFFFRMHNRTLRNYLGMAQEILQGPESQQ